MKLPNELVAQIDGINFETLSKEEKIKEIDWCIDRCDMNFYEYPEKRRYYINQIKLLKKLKTEM